MKYEIWGKYACTETFIQRATCDDKQTALLLCMAGCSKKHFDVIDIREGEGQPRAGKTIYRFVAADPMIDGYRFSVTTYEWVDQAKEEKHEDDGEVN